ncbi:hypothetical protein D3C87_1497430 [compost metagenome]
MKKLIILSLLVAGSAYAGGSKAVDAAGGVIGGATFITFSPFLSSYSFTGCGLKIGHCFEKQIIIDAQEDAAAFVGSEGTIRGVRLQRAMETIRIASPDASVSDIQLAREILAVQ